MNILFNQEKTAIAKPISSKRVVTASGLTWEAGERKNVDILKSSIALAEVIGVTGIQGPSQMVRIVNMTDNGDRLTLTTENVTSNQLTGARWTLTIVGYT